MLSSTLEPKYFVLFSGPSGIGKTSIVNFLIKKFPMVYKRPVSYTSRLRRQGESNEEYIFSNKNDIKSLYEEGCLLNIDNVYDNLYGISKSSLKNLWDNNFIPIKEIHPNNIDNLLNGDILAIKVLILPSSKKSSSFLGYRRNEDFVFYRNSKMLDCFDIIVYNDFEENIEILSKDIDFKIRAIIEDIDTFPLPSEIDKFNKRGYSKILPEFTEEKRITTRNFHTLTYNYFSEYIKDISKESTILEIGPGKYWLENEFQLSRFDYWTVDLVKTFPENKKFINSSIRAIDIEKDFFDHIICSLMDPYFYPIALREIHRLLKKDGKLIFTIPAHEWALTIRPTHVNLTEFINEKNEKIEVFSFVFPVEKIYEILHRNGFNVEKVYVIHGEFPSNEYISPALKHYSNLKDISIEQLPVVYFITASPNKSL